MSLIEHRGSAPDCVKVMVLTVSDTRDEHTDRSGQLMMRLLQSAGHIITRYQIVKDEQDAIQQELSAGLEDKEVDAIICNGGTGIAYRDVTIETIKGLLDKEMPGFGEIFRMLSYQEDIGSAAILSRAIAGVTQGKVIFATPGSTGAVELAMNKLILPELAHVVRELKKDL
ncbi:molybdenum cofactor biosynthesis protein B [Bacillus sp. D386]|uniref:MogA/MoaB family molybdenum cofactor biosynthesis protein n=1 Tax=Bacillus sp. D386 TaxID=2587155 RepID=UPI00111D1103|nr:MogA/MoaB family molybdenum cofactor biosynthesis protein [Bacillus sp. D386]